MPWLKRCRLQREKTWGGGWGLGEGGGGMYVELSAKLDLGRCMDLLGGKLNERSSGVRDRLLVVTIKRGVWSRSRRLTSQMGMFGVRFLAWSDSMFRFSVNNVNSSR